MELLGFAYTDRALEFLGTLPPKIRRQVARKAKALHAEPHPASAKRLHDVKTPTGDAVFRERSGDYRILYIVRSQPAEVVILDIGNRKEVYRMPKVTPPDELKMREADFDKMMQGALGVPAPADDAPKAAPKPRRLAAYPAKPKKQKSAGE